MIIDKFEKAKRLRECINAYKNEIRFWEKCEGYNENYGRIVLHEENKPGESLIKVCDSRGFTVVLSSFLPFSELRNRALLHYRSLIDDAEFQFEQL